MSSEAEQFRNYQFKLYGAFCRGRLAESPTPDYDAVELAAHALGVERINHPLPNVAEVWRMVAELLAPAIAPDPTSSPTTPDPSSVPKALASRVLQILGQLGIDPADFHRRGQATPTTARAYMARRVVILQLRNEGWSVNETAGATLLDPWTVRAHLRAARQRADWRRAVGMMRGLGT